MTKATIVLLQLIPVFILGQNLVPNSSFEQIEDTISKFIDSNVEFNDKVNSWYSPNIASPDLITPEFNEKFIDPPNAHSGLNSIGLQWPKHKRKNQYWGECVGIELLNELKVNHTYQVEFYIRRAKCIAPSKDNNEYLNSNIGIFFTSDSILRYNSLMIENNVYINGSSTTLITNEAWTKITNYYTPTEKVRFLYLGQFKNENGEEPEVMNGYYVFDDVSVVEITDFSLLDTEKTLPVGSIVPLKNIHFKSGTTAFKNKQYSGILSDLAEYLKSNELIRVQVNGHTDSMGNSNMNLLLSEKRAKTIVDFLIQSGIEKNRLEWKGFGEHYPITENSNEEGRSENRRVEFEVIK